MPPKRGQQSVEPDLPQRQAPTQSGEEPIDYTDGGAFPGEAPIFQDPLYGDAAASEEPLPEVVANSIPETGMRFDPSVLDRIQTPEDLQRAPGPIRELYILTDPNIDEGGYGLQPTQEQMSKFVMQRFMQEREMETPLYRAKLEEQQGRAMKAMREGRGESFLASGWEQYRDEGGQMNMRPIPGGPADREIRASSKMASETAMQALRSLKQAEALVGFWTTGLPGTLVSMVPGTDANSLASALNTGGMQIGIDRLLEVKKAGGAFGALSEKELEGLKAQLGALTINLPPNVLRSNIANATMSYENVLAKMNPEDQQMYDRIMSTADTGGGGASAAPVGKAEKTGRVETFGKSAFEEWTDGQWRKKQ
jgi:hypothetical protein